MSKVLFCFPPLDDGPAIKGGNALGESFGYMFPNLYQKLRGYKIQKRWDSE